MLSVARHDSFQSNSWDLGAANLLAANLREGRLRLPIEPLNPGNTIGLHSYGGIALLVFLGWFSPDPRLALLLQTGMLGLAAWPLYLLARERFHDARAAAIVAITYLLYPPLHLFALADFHFASFAIAPLFGAQIALSRGKWRAFGVWAGLAAAFQVEALLVVALLGLHHAFARRDWRRGGGIAAGAVSFILLHGWFFGTLTADIIHGRPWRFIPWAWGAATPSFGADRVTYLAMLVLPLFLTPFSGLLAALIALPLLALPFLGPPPTGDFRDWYTALLIAALFIGVVEGVRRFQILAKRRVQRGRWGVAARRLRHVPVIAIMIGAIMGGVTYGLLPPSTTVGPRLFTVTAHDRLANTILARIPPGASVSAQNNLLPHLAGRTRVSLFPDIAAADYVILDTSTPWIAALDEREYTRRIMAVLEDPAYGVVLIEDGYVLLGRGRPHQPVADTLTALYSRTYRVEEFGRPIGRSVTEPLAMGGQVAWAIAPIDGAGFLAANRQLALPPGSYVATFWLGVDWQDQTRDVASLQVASDFGAGVIAQRQLTGLDFIKPGVYDGFQLVFSVSGDPVEPRIYWDGTVSLRFSAMQIAPTEATINDWRSNLGR